MAKPPARTVVAAIVREKDNVFVAVPPEFNDLPITEQWTTLRAAQRAIDRIMRITSEKLEAHNARYGQQHGNQE
jgi:hypothetical protein